MTLNMKAPHARRRWVILGFAVAGLMALAIGVVLASIPSNFFVVTDTGGANDVPGQVDLTQMGRDDTDSTKYKLFWSWDSTDSWTGTGQTGDACALFDSDGDGNINQVVCGQVDNPGADPAIVAQTATSPYFFNCSDKKNDRCTNPSPITYTWGTQIISGPIGNVTSANRFANLIDASDPFATGSNHPNDSVLEVDILKSSLNAGSNLVNVCSYPSAGNGGNNNPFDCIVTPGGGFLKIVKNVSGGTSQTFDFTLNPAPPSPESATYTLAPTAAKSGTDSTANIAVLITNSQGVTETIPSGWSLSSASCSIEGVAGTTGNPDLSTGAITGITISSGKLTTCTFTDAPIQPKLKLAKTVVNDNGGTAVAKDFTLAATGSSGSFSATAGTSTTSLTGDTGSQTVVGGVTYTLSETGPSGYSAGSWSCTGTGGHQSGSTVSIDYGGDVTCSITNDDEAGTLIVKKLVVNDNGGTKIATDFSFQVNGGTATAFLQDTDTLHGKNTLTVDAGTYSVTEPAVSGYATTYNNCTSVVVANGGTQTCTITNDDQKASPGIGTTMKWTLNDTVTLSGFRTGGTGGTASFYLYKGDATCSDASKLVFSELSVAVNNSTGVATTTTGYTTSDSGTYYWFVTYSGNNYNAANDGTGTCGDEVTTLP